MTMENCSTWNATLWKTTHTMQKSKIHQKQAKIMYFSEIQYPKMNLKYLKHYDSPLKIELRTMLVICSRIFVVRQQNKLFVIHKQKCDEQLFVKFNNFGSKLLDFFWKINSFFLKTYFLSQISSMKYNIIVNLSHKNGYEIGKMWNKLEL